MSVFVSPTHLATMIHSGEKVTVLDAHWQPGTENALTHYMSEHIPNAQFCPPEFALAGVPSRQDGRNPLPRKDQLQKWIYKWGIDKKSPIVVYGTDRGLYAARAWWILRWAGFNNVSILDGNLQAWEAEGYNIVGGPGNIPQRNHTEITIGNMPTVTTAEVENWVGQGGVLIDARDKRRYDGIAERLDFQAGHIPGATNIPVLSLRDKNHKVFAPDEIQARLDREGIRENTKVAVYSGSALHSCLMIAIMEYAGLTGAHLYAGGWSQWAGDPKREIARTN